MITVFLLMVVKMTRHRGGDLQDEIDSDDDDDGGRDQHDLDCMLIAVMTRMVVLTMITSMTALRHNGGYCNDNDYDDDK